MDYVSVECLLERLVEFGIVMHGIEWRHAFALGLTPLQRHILVLIASADQCLRASDLAARLDAAPQTISNAIGTLRSKHLVRNIPLENDRRASLLALTTDGKSVAQAATNAPEPLYRAFASLTPSERRLFLRVMERIVQGTQLSKSGPSAG